MNVKTSVVKFLQIRKLEQKSGVNIRFSDQQKMKLIKMHR